MKPYGSKRQDRGRVMLLTGKKRKVRGRRQQCRCCPDKGGFKKGRARRESRKQEQE